jgi:RNA polymerase sigma-70 factor (ECF subfamily)
MSMPHARQAAGASLAGLLARIARGDQAAFAELYHRTAAQVLGLATVMLGDTAAAEDVTAEAYQQLWHTAGRYDPARGSAHAWLMGMTHRHAARHLRANRDLASTAATQLASLPPASLPTVLQRLDPPSRELILLAYYRGYTAAQAASLLGLPVSAALPRVLAALRTLSPSCSPVPEPVASAAQPPSGSARKR